MGLDCLKMYIVLCAMPLTFVSTQLKGDSCLTGACGNQGVC